MSYYQDQSSYNQAQRADERKFYRRQLDEMTNAYNLGSSWGQGGAADHAMSATAGGLPRVSKRIGQNLKYGESADEKALSAFSAQQKGGRRGTNRSLTPKKTTKTRRMADMGIAARGQKKRDVENDLQKFFREAEEKIEEANSANESRYKEIMGDLDDRYNRVMSRIGNFGQAARADLQERAAEALGNISANLSARGLGNSTILSSFQQRNARDLAREQQRLSEIVDTRAMNADMKMTADKAGFMERREDVAPDYNMLMQLSAKYGRGNEGQGFNDNGGMLNQVQNQPQQYQQSLPPGAVAAGRNRGPITMNGFNPMGYMQNMAGWGAGPGYTYTPQDKPEPYKDYYKLGETDVPLPPIDRPYGPEQVYESGATDVPLPPPLRPDPSRASIGDDIYREQVNRQMDTGQDAYWRNQVQDQMKKNPVYQPKKNTALSDINWKNQVLDQMKQSPKYAKGISSSPGYVDPYEPRLNALLAKPSWGEYNHYMSRKPSDR